MTQLWKSFRCLPSELNLNIVLACGQSFRWAKNLEDEWIGVVGKRVWFLKQGEDSVFYKSFEMEKDILTQAGNETNKGKKLDDICLSSHFPQQQHELNSKCIDNEEGLLTDYFQLEIVLESLYKQWCSRDNNFNSLSYSFDGIRMLRQDPIENLFSFICSQNNHISRISSMVEKLCLYFGDKICEIDGKKYHAFPTLSALSAENVEEELRGLGFGYRAKFIHQCAKQILNNHSVKWLYELRSVSYKEAHKALCELPGVGPKVADCVCLMSLDKTEAIPVDTHMWQIAQRDYLPHLKKYKSLTDKIYQEIGDHFRSIYGDFAGWAHSVLFSADLRRFRDLKEASKQPILEEKEAPKQRDKEIKTENNLVKANTTTENTRRSKSTISLDASKKRKSPRITGSQKDSKQRR